MSARRWTTLGVLLMGAALVRGAGAQEGAMTLERALELARAQALEAGVALLRIDEARGRLEGASALLGENPELGIGLGPRLTSPGLAVEAELSQGLELGGRRSARMDAARAGVARALAAHEDASRRALEETGIAFYRALHAQELLGLAARGEALAEATLAIAERRYQAGDVPILHVNVGRGGLARARSALRAAEAGLAGALGELKSLTGLGAGEPLVLEGALSARARFDRVAAAEAAARERADLRVVASELREAEADLRLGRGLGWPELDLGVEYLGEEAGSTAILGTLRLTLPLFQRGQGVRAEALARARRLQFEQEALRRRAELEVDTARAVYLKRVEAVVALEAALPVQAQSEALARTSYELGELGLADLLLVRREVLETQVDFLGRQLEAAAAGIALEAAAGALD